jgi:hypothetical protein
MKPVTFSPVRHRGGFGAEQPALRPGADLAARPARRARRAGRALTLPAGLVVASLLAVALAGPPAAFAGAISGPVAAPAPGGSVSWQPASRVVLGRPVVYTGSVGGAFVAWMDPELVRPVVVPGTGDPFGSPWGGQVDPSQQKFLVAAFNGGFKAGDFSGAVLAFGSQYRSPVDGQGSFVVYDDGSFTVGVWPRDVDPNKLVVGLRQNLGMLVDGGAPTPAAGSPGNWGGSVAGVATMRGAVGVDAGGGLVWAGGRLSPQDLANALVAAGAVRGMQLDINPDWVNFNTYDVGADGVAHGNGVFGATGADRYLRPDSRDFIAVLVRGTVAKGAAAKLGATPLQAEVKLD